MPYSEKVWKYGDEITPSDMNAIEQGIKNATNTSDANKSDIALINTNVSAMQTDVDNKYAQLNLQDVELQIDGYVTPIFGTVHNTIEDGIYHKRIGRFALWEIDWEETSQASIFQGVLPKNTFSGTLNAKIDGYKPTSVGFADLGNKCFRMTATFFRIRNDSYTDINSFKATLINQYLFYELAQEETYNINGSARIDNLESAIGNTVNLLNPTLRDTVRNGVAVHYENGTYTLNGTATTHIYFELETIANLNLSKTYKLLGCPQGGSYWGGGAYNIYANDGKKVDIGNGIIFTPTDNTFILYVCEGATLNNVTFRPMLTTNLSATVDDFVPFTGNTGKLNYDVAEIQSGKENVFNIRLNGVDMTDFLNALCNYVQEKGSGIYQGAWIGHDYYVAIMHKVTDYMCVGMLSYGVNSPSMYIVNRTPSDTNYRKVTTTSI